MDNLSNVEDKFPAEACLRVGKHHTILEIKMLLCSHPLGPERDEPERMEKAPITDPLSDAWCRFSIGVGNTSVDITSRCELCGLASQVIFPLNSRGQESAFTRSNISIIPNPVNTPTLAPIDTFRLRVIERISFYMSYRGVIIHSYTPSMLFGDFCNFSKSCQLTCEKTFVTPDFTCQLILVDGANSYALTPKSSRCTSKKSAALECMESFLHKLVSCLNGNNGEWTNSDDVEQSCGVCHCDLYEAPAVGRKHWQCAFQQNCACVQLNCLSCISEIVIRSYNMSDRLAPGEYHCPTCRAKQYCAPAFAFKYNKHGLIHIVNFAEKVRIGRANNQNHIHPDRYAAMLLSLHWATQVYGSVATATARRHPSVRGLAMPAGYVRLVLADPNVVNPPPPIHHPDPPAPAGDPPPPVDPPAPIDNPDPIGAPEPEPLAVPAVNPLVAVPDAPHPAPVPAPNPNPVPVPAPVVDPIVVVDAEAAVNAVVANLVGVGNGAHGALAPGLAVAAPVRAQRGGRANNVPIPPNPILPLLAPLPVDPPNPEPVVDWEATSRISLYTKDSVFSLFPYFLPIYVHVVLFIFTLGSLTFNGHRVSWLLMILLPICIKNAPIRESALGVVVSLITFFTHAYLLGEKSLYLSFIDSCDDLRQSYRYLHNNPDPSMWFFFCCAIVVVAVYCLPIISWGYGRSNFGFIRLRESRLIGYPVVFSDHFPPHPDLKGYTSTIVYINIYNSIVHSRSGNNSTKDLLRFIAGDIGALVNQHKLTNLSQLVLMDTQIAIHQAILTQRQFEEGHNVDPTPGVRDIMW